jgi:hypothetical protein
MSKFPIVIHRKAAERIVESWDFSFLSEGHAAEDDEEAAWLELARAVHGQVKAHLVVELELEQARALFRRAERLAGTVTDRTTVQKLQRLLRQKNVVDG